MGNNLFEFYVFPITQYCLIKALNFVFVHMFLFTKSITCVDFLFKSNFAREYKDIVEPEEKSLKITGISK